MANVMDSSVPYSKMGVPFQPPFIHTQTYYSELKTTKVSDHVCFSLEESSLLLCNVGMKKAILYTLSSGSLKHRFPPSFNFAVWKMAPSEKESHAEFASSFFPPNASGGIFKVNTELISKIDWCSFFVLLRMHTLPKNRVSQSFLGLKQFLIVPFNSSQFTVF